MRRHLEIGIYSDIVVIEILFAGVSRLQLPLNKLNKPSWSTNDWIIIHKDISLGQHRFKTIYKLGRIMGNV